MRHLRRSAGQIGPAHHAGWCALILLRYLHSDCAESAGAIGRLSTSPEFALHVAYNWDSLDQFAVLYPAASVRWARPDARLQTADTELVLEAGSAAPRLVSLGIPGFSPTGRTALPKPNFNCGFIGSGRARASGPSTAEPARPVNNGWLSSTIRASPHLRLTWEWRTRQAYGPIEHQIRIENLDNQEIWIPMQDSLALNWQVDPQSALEHFFVEKGANTPSSIGTHQVAVDRGLPLDWHVQHLRGSARK